MSFEECGNNSFKMSEVISDCMVSPSISIPIRLDDIPEIDIEGPKISTTILLSNGFDGTGDRDDRRVGSTQPPPENKLLPKQRPLRLPLPPCKIKSILSLCFRVRY